MSLAARAPWLVIVMAAFLGAMGCGNHVDCTCTVTRNSERRVLACGDSACVDGITFNCADQDQSVQRGACSAPPVSTIPDLGGPAPSASAVVDPSCDELLVFCNTQCPLPASVSVDCQTTANTADPAACATWSTTNGLLCHP